MREEFETKKEIRLIITSHEELKTRKIVYINLVWIGPEGRKDGNMEAEGDIQVGSGARTWKRRQAGKLGGWEKGRNISKTYNY